LPMPLRPGELGIEITLGGGSGDRHNAYERKPLVGGNGRVAHDDAWSGAARFVSEHWVQGGKNDRTAGKCHSLSSIQPSPGTHRTGFPAVLSTRDSASSCGRLRAQSAKPGLDAARRSASAAF
jgi:hypothetical protein